MKCNKPAEIYYKWTDGKVHYGCAEHAAQVSKLCDFMVWTYICFHLYEGEETCSQETGKEGGG